MKELPKLDLIIIADGDDISVRFVEPSLFDEIISDKDKDFQQYRRTLELKLGEAIENEDSRIIKFELAQTYRLDASINLQMNLGRVLSIEG